MLALLLTLALQGGPDESVAETITPTDWLVIEQVDARGRRPFRPDAVFARFLLEPGAAPAAGETVRGSEGEASWQRVEADGAVRMPGRGAYAYARVEVAEDGVYLADLRRAAQLFVNGAATCGDIYRYGFDGYPVHLRAGVNHLFVTGARGAFELTLRRVEPGLRFAPRDRIVPDLVRGEAGPVHVGLLLVNASPEWCAWPDGSAFDVEAPDFVEVRLGGGPGGLAPLGLARRVLNVSVSELPEDVEEVRIRLHEPNNGASTEVTLRVREPGELHRRSYLSRVDHSVQEYAVLPPSGEEADGPMRLALSLHGAGVGCMGQANSYAPKPDFWIVAPTNRRKFGFDWQDWGRQDAYEVLDEALELSGVDPRHVYVTGHSMGGHGTWHLAANDPDRFAACGPSAGWATFDTYGGRPEQDERWRRADAASLTLELIDNLKQVPSFVIHGTNDRNVPPTQALTMLEALTRADATVEVHLEGGAGHWWGNRCVDWPPLFEHFRRHELPENPDRIDFVTVDPAVDAEHHWVTVVQQREYGKSSRVQARWEDGRIEIQTENVRRLHLARAADEVVLDGESLGSVAPAVQSPFERAHVPFVRTEEGWRRAANEAFHFDQKGPMDSEASARLDGPFKRVFDRGFLLVVGTQGDDARDAALLARARHDQAKWAYRGNGRAVILTDAELQPWIVPVPMGPQRNVILYGNRDDNAAWGVFGEEPPVDFADGVVRVGERTWEGDYAGVFVVRDDARLVGAFASTSTRAARLGDTFAPFVSGVGYPDYAVVGADVLERGDEAVVAAGWFDHAWRLPEQE